MQIPQIPEGLVCRDEYIVTDEYTAKHIGSGEVEVLATPAMILFMERTALLCVQRYLPENLTTVGTLVNVKHVNPVPKNEKVVVEAKLIKIEGRKLTFEVRASWKDLLIGEGIHERFIVDRQRFAEKVRRLLEEHK